MLSPKAKRNIKRIIPFSVMWLVFSMVYTLLERGLLGRINYYPSTGNPYDFGKNIFAIPALALVTGVLIGVLETYYFSKWFSQKSFGKKLLYKSLIYLFIILLFLLLTFIFTQDNIFSALSSKDLWADAWAFFTSYSILGVTLYIASIIVVVQFYTEVRESMGQGALNNFFAGKYHQPIEEERVFMFLDMRSSTTIAEELGHVRYFEMLREYFADLAQPVIDYEGEIYQYAGDEMIISWKLKNGLKNNNCIQCFFAMKKQLSAQSKKYESRFGLLPEFKAGIHYGKVTTGEIGVLKKEIIFTGDVLNTTARIQGLCNQYDVDILISSPLVNRLQPDLLVQARSLGEIKLKGREQAMELFTMM